MAYRRINGGYTVTNPRGELLLYHSVGISLNVGVEVDHDTIEAATNGQTSFVLSLESGHTVIEDTLVSRLEGVTLTGTAITDGDVSSYVSDTTGHTLQVTNTGLPNTSPANGRQDGGIVRIGNSQILNVQSFSVSSGTLLMHFGAQALRVAAANQITGSIDAGTSDIMSITLRPIDVNIVSYTAATTTAVISLPAFDGELVDFDFDARVSQTHTIDSSTTAGQVHIPLVIGDEVEITAAGDSNGYIVVDDTPYAARI